MNLGFVGVGHIASAIVEGLCHSKPQDLTIYLSPRGEKHSTRLDKSHAFVHRLQNNQQVVNHSDIVVIAVRPGDAKSILREISFKQGQTVISLIPFLELEELVNTVAPAGFACRAIPLPTVVNHTCPIPLFNATSTVIELFNRIGQPLQLSDEQQLHTIWTLTGFITPFYDLLDELSAWAVQNGVEQQASNRYLADLFQSLSYGAQQDSTIDFAELSNHAATPNGMNEQAGKELRDRGAHTAYTEAADKLLNRFKGNL